MLFLITNRQLIKKGSLYNVILESLHGGLNGVILREKDLPREDLLRIAFKLRNITSSFGATLIVNGDSYVSKAVNADFFHSGLKSFNKETMFYGAPFGLSTHTLEETIIGEKLGASYLLLSHIFHTNCKKNLPPKGINIIKKATKKCSIPIIGLGGINEKNITSIIISGAYGAGVMSAIMGSENPYESTLKLKNAMLK